MDNILAFPGKASSSTAAHSDVLQSDAEPLVVTSIDGTLVLSRTVNEQRISGDWSNQDVADLYRVEALLVQAGIRLSTERGLTDENDPWFVFLREDGEVFVHLARINGTYLLDSPGLGALLEGPDFPSLIDRFVRQMAMRSEPKDNIVTFRPRMLHDQTVRLHPVVMLAALVWSLYLASDSIVGTAHAADSLSSNSGHIPADVMAHGDNDSTWAHSVNFAVDLLANHDAGQAAINAQQAIANGDRQIANAQEALRGPSHQDGRAQAAAVSSSTFAPSQSVATSIAVIALGFGLYDPNPIADHVAGQATKATALALNSSLEPAENHSALPQPPHANGAPIEVEVGKAHVENPEQAHTKIPELTVDAPAHTLAPLAPYELTKNVDTFVIEASSPHKMSVPPAENVSAVSAGVGATSASTEKTAQVVVHETVASQQSGIGDAQSVMTLVSKYISSISQNDPANLLVSSTLDSKSLNKVLMQLDGAASEATQAKDQTATDASKVTSNTDNSAASSSPAPARPAAAHQEQSILGIKLEVYNTQAKEFVHSFILDVGSIEILQIKNEILLVDMTAIDEKTDNAVAHSWSIDDGRVISIIGHHQTFVDHGLM